MQHLIDAFHDLAALVASVGEHDLRRPQLAALVAELERAAGAELGDTDESSVVLWRRFSRAHRLLLRPGWDGDREELAARLQHHSAALRGTTEGLPPEPVHLRLPVLAAVVPAATATAEFGAPIG